MLKKYSPEELVMSCYKTILGRAPENSSVVKEKVNSHASIDEILSSFIDSEEFQDKKFGSAIHEYLLSNHFDSQCNIETDVSDEILARMFKRIQAGWQRLGDTEPYWSIITSDEFKLSNLDKHLDEFISSGPPTVKWLENVAQRNGVVFNKTQTCFELGCGVGRLSLALSDTFGSVLGVDVSKGNLKECDTLIEKTGKTNIKTQLLENIGDLSKIDGFDVFYSVIVLQHNPPPVQKFMLEAILKKVNRGGIAYFQLPTRLPNYSFSAKEYLNEKMEDMEMHALPMHVVFYLLKEAGFSLLEVFQDHSTGLPGSHTFFAIKTEDSPEARLPKRRSWKPWKLFKG